MRIEDLVQHQYFARPMEGETDLLTDDQLNPPDHKILSQLDSVILGRLKGFPR